MDDHAVKRVLDLPMGATLIDYEKESYFETFIQFYKVLVTKMIRMHKHS